MNPDNYKVMLNFYIKQYLDLAETSVSNAMTDPHLKDKYIKTAKKNIKKCLASIETIRELQNNVNYKKEEEQKLKQLSDKLQQLTGHGPGRSLLSKSLFDLPWTKQPTKLFFSNKKLKKKTSNQWIYREGKLGGPGFLKRPRSEQMSILDACVSKYGYKSCLGSILVLNRNKSIKKNHGKLIDSIKQEFMMKYSHRDN